LTNPWAYVGQSRNTPEHFDGLNLARQFPGEPDGSRTQQHAALLFEWVTRILTPDDVFIDFHSAGTYYEYASMVGYHPTGDATESASRDLAFAFGFDNVWQIPESPSSTRTFNGSISRVGIPTIGTEIRGWGGLRESDVRDQVAGLQNILAHKAMLPNPPAVVDRAISTTHQICFSSSGLLRPEVDINKSVSADQPLGRVVSIEGDTLEQLTAPHDGQIWAIRRFASVHPEDIAFLISRPIIAD
jgi:predicted deacylase